MSPVSTKELREAPRGRTKRGKPVPGVSDYPSAARPAPYAGRFRRGSTVPACTNYRPCALRGGGCDNGVDY